MLASDCFAQKKFLIARLSYEMGLQLDPQNENIRDFEELTHDSIICDSCLNPIKGFRFRCELCDDYDLCRKCFERRMELHDGHEDFLQIPDESTWKGKPDYHQIGGM